MCPKIYRVATVAPHTALDTTTPLILYDSAATLQCNVEAVPCHLPGINRGIKPIVHLLCAFALYLSCWGFSPITHFLASFSIFLYQVYQSKLGPRMASTPIGGPVAGAAISTLLTLQELYGQESLSDVTIIIQAEDQVLKTVPGHKVVLATESEVFRTRVTRWSGNRSSNMGSGCELHLQTPQQQQQQQKVVVDSPLGQQQEFPQQQQQQAGREHLLLLLDHPGQLEAAEHLLQFFYRQSLPPGLTYQQLLSLLMLAHYHAAPRCQAACVAALVEAADQLDWEAWFSMLELPQALRQQEAQLAALFDEADEFMLKQLVELDVALNQPQQLAWFLSLPAPYLVRLAGRKDLSLAAESTLVTAITMWLEQQPQELVTDELLVELVAQIRMVGLPPSFMINVLPHLWWFKRVVPPGEQSRGGKLCLWSLGRGIGPIGRSSEWVSREMGLNTWTLISFRQ